MYIDDIIKGCKIGDRKCQKKLFEMFYGKMFVVANRYIRNKQVAQDVLSDSFIKVFNNIHKFNIGGNIGGWIKMIVVNTSIDVLRKDKNIFFSEIDPNLNLNEEVSVDFFKEMNISPEDCIRVINSLPSAYRTVFNMIVFEEMTHKDIAKKLGISENTSKSNYSKARVIINNRIFESMNNKKSKRKR